MEYKYKMIQYSTLNVTMSNLQLNKFRSGIKNGTGVALKLSWNAVSDSNDENNFPHKLFLINTLTVSRLHKVLSNGSSANIKLSKPQLHNIGRSRFLSRFLQTWLKTGLRLMKNVLKTLVKSVSTPLGLTAAVSATDAAV